MNKTASVAYKESGEQATEVLERHGKDLQRDERAFLVQRKKRARTLQTIERLTGLKFDVFSKGDPHVAAFITVDGLETHIAENSLDDPVWAAYAAWHEKMHKDTAAFMKMGEHAYFPGDQYDALKNKMAANDVHLGNVDLTEGFTDMLTGQEHGQHANSGYNDHEVPAAEKLEKICLKLTGDSLAEAFRANDTQLFHDRLERLARVLMMREAYEKAEKSGEWDVAPEEMTALKSSVYKKMSAESGVLASKRTEEEMAKHFLDVARQERDAYLAAAPAND